HTSKAGVTGRLAARLAGVPAVVHGVHILPFDNVPAGERWLYLAIERALAPATHAFVNVSEGMQTLGLEHRVGRPERHFVVPSGMDVAAFRQAQPFTPAELSERLGGRRPGPLLVFTAALEPRKRQFEFLDCMAAVRRRVPGALLVLLGEGHDESRIRARIAELELNDAVHLAGYSTEVPRWIASSRACVFASEREGLPRAVIQYVLGGRPVVSTRLPGIEAVVEHDDNGFLVDIDRLDAMVEPLVTVLTEPETERRLATASRDRNLSAWDQAHMAARLAEIYSNVRASQRRLSGAAA
ncbi:MAG: glycosyltransferase, partial [Brevundimonas sp.]